MSKKNKNFDNEFELGAPEVICLDDIGYMSEEIINDRMNRLERERNRAISMGHEPILWDVELAYLQREQNVRQIRSESHAAYMKKLPFVSDVADANTTVKTSTTPEMN